MKCLKTILPALFAVSLFSAPMLASAAPLTLPADSSKIYQVQGLGAGNVLKLYEQPGRGIIVNIPHNATWIVRRNAQVRVGNTLWERVTWDSQTGWVKSARLNYDARATQIARERRECMRNPAVKDKMCCGYPEAAKGVPFRSVPIFSVRGLKAGQSLMMYRENSNLAIEVEIPHNATWVAKLGKAARVGKDTWEYVRWSGQNGWVNGKYLTFDPAKTREGDEKRRRCSTSGRLLPAAQSQVVCLPISVINRLQAAGAISPELIAQLRAQAAAANK